MGQALSDILLPAVGVLISPLPVAGLILILLSDRARSNSVFYMCGWIAGNMAMFLLGMFFMHVGVKQGDSDTLSKVVSLVLGTLLLLCAVREFMRRPKKGEKAPTPKWFAKVSEISILGAAVLAFSLSVLNPVNALLSLGAGAAVGALHLTHTQQAGITVLFVTIASASIIVPTVAFLIAGHRLDKALDALRDWLIQNNAVILSVLLLLIGLNMVGQAF